ncbi:MAG: VOC family protein [bacterium]|nr:VOC family protein [bacterium]MCY4102035.1 VOC family protein [bacterium]
MSQVVAFNHFNVTVSDMDRSLVFWRDLLGLDLLGRGIVEYRHLDEIVGLENTRIEWAELALPGGGMIEVFRYHRPVGSAVRPRIPDPGCTHVCLEVEGLDRLVERLRDAGVNTRSRRPVRIPFGDWKDVKSIYVQDPDGVTVELIEQPTGQPQRAAS